MKSSVETLDQEYQIAAMSLNRVFESSLIDSRIPLGRSLLSIHGAIANERWPNETGVAVGN